LPPGPCLPHPAYQFLRTSGGTPLSWRTQAFPVEYTLNQAGSDDVPLAEVQTTTQRSFATWEAVPSASITFRFAGTTSQLTTGNDGVNLIRWYESHFPFDQDSLAVTVNTYNDVTGEMLDADINVNGTFNWSVNPGAGRFDLESVLTHEIGHVCGWPTATTRRRPCTPTPARARHTSAAWRRTTSPA